MLSLSLGQTDGRFCDGVSRRQMLRLGGTGALAGLSLPGLLELEDWREHLDYYPEGDGFMCDKDGKEIAQKTAHFTPDPSEKKPSNAGRKRKAGPPASEPAFPMIMSGITDKVDKGEDAD